MRRLPDARDLQRSRRALQASGVSVRLTIALLENVTSNAERRALRLGHKRVVARLADLFAAESAVTGKIELVFEGEREGPAAVADRILGEGVLTVFQRYFPAPYRSEQRRREPEPKDAYKPIVDWFAAGHSVVVQDEAADVPALRKIPALADLAAKGRVAGVRPVPPKAAPSTEAALAPLFPGFDLGAQYQAPPLPPGRALIDDDGQVAPVLSQRYGLRVDPEMPGCLRDGHYFSRRQVDLGLLDPDLAFDVFGHSPPYCVFYYILPQNQ